MQLPFPPNPTQHTRLRHPETGNVSFGVVPEMLFNKVTWPTGDAILFYGRREFGALHIFERHEKEMARKGFHGLEQTPAFVASILRARAPIYLEGGSRRERFAVVQAVSGTVVLELKTSGECLAYYSVVTAFLAFTGHGKRIGILQQPK